ncbi:hypothetical protein STEG23_006176 [Scotinomys teguina]
MFQYQPAYKSHVLKSSVVIRILPSIGFPYPPLGDLLSFFEGPFLGLGSDFGGAGLADNLEDLLCGSSFTLALSPLVSPSAFLSGMAVAEDFGAGRRDAAVRGFGLSGGRSRCFFTLLLNAS